VTWQRPQESCRGITDTLKWAISGHRAGPLAIIHAQLTWHNPESRQGRRPDADPRSRYPVLLAGPADQVRSWIEAAIRGRFDVVTVTDSPEEAWATYSAAPVPIVVLAHLDEEILDLSRRIRASGGPEGATILVVVASDEQALLPEVVEAGADDYVIAPLETERLSARLAFAERKARDRERRERVEAELEIRALQQAVVSELGQRALAGADPPSLMEFAVAATADALGVELCKVLEKLPRQEAFLIKAGVGWMPGYVGYAKVDAGGDSQAGHTLTSSEPVIVGDLAKETRFTGAQILHEHRVVSGLSVVIAGDPTPYGVLSAHSRHPRTFSRDDIHFVQAVANVLAAAIERKRSDDALSESEAKSRAILDTTVDGIVTIDAWGTIESFNPAAERIFGYAAEEVIGENVNVLMPTPYKEDHDGYLKAYRETGRRKIIGIGREVVGRRKDGSTFPLDLSVSEVGLDGRRIFTGIVRDITERRRLEQEILETSEQERRRIGQDLHDGLGQMLTGIGLISRNLARKLRENGYFGAGEAEEITDLIREADQHARGLARGLVPVELDAAGLATALQRLAFNAERLFGIQCVFEEIHSPLLHDNTAATHLYRIAQEAVSNAVKHGRASRVVLRLASADDQVRLRVQDDGVGFPDVLEENQGMGVRIMHHRARIIGATLEIRRADEGGTVLTCTLPRLEMKPRRTIA
jgi:two-component system, LuxR family, sensor kinase FixL